MFTFNDIPGSLISLDYLSVGGAWRYNKTPAIKHSPGKKMRKRLRKAQRKARRANRK